MNCRSREDEILLKSPFDVNILCLILLNNETMNHTEIKYTIEKLTPLYYTDWKEELLELYLHAFTTGEFAQYVRREDASEKLDEFQRVGSGAVAFLHGKPVGALMGVPFTSDAEFPFANHPEIPVKTTAYIAELMVHVHVRGLGIASALIHEYLKNETLNGVTDAVIRVWIENIPAVKLYEKLGFRRIEEITQTKYKSETENFEMQKIYLHKKL